MDQVSIIQLCPDDLILLITKFSNHYLILLYESIRMLKVIKAIETLFSSLKFDVAAAKMFLFVFNSDVIVLAYFIHIGYNLFIFVT